MNGDGDRQAVQVDAILAEKDDRIRALEAEVAVLRVQNEVLRRAALYMPDPDLPPEERLSAKQAAYAEHRARRKAMLGRLDK